MKKSLLLFLSFFVLPSTHSKTVEERLEKLERQVQELRGLHGLEPAKPTQLPAELVGNDNTKWGYPGGKGTLLVKEYYVISHDNVKRSDLGGSAERKDNFRRYSLNRGSSRWWIGWNTKDCVGLHMVHECDNEEGERIGRSGLTNARRHLRMRRFPEEFEIRKVKDSIPNRQDWDEMNTKTCRELRKVGCTFLDVLNIPQNGGCHG